MCHAESPIPRKSPTRTFICDDALVWLITLAAVSLGWWRYAATSADRMVVQHVRLDGKLSLEAGGHLAVSADGKHVAARIGKEGVGIWRAADLIQAATAAKK